MIGRTVVWVERSRKKNSKSYCCEKKVELCFGSFSLEIEGLVTYIGTGYLTEGGEEICLSGFYTLSLKNDGEVRILWISDLQVAYNQRLEFLALLYFFWSTINGGMDPHVSNINHTIHTTICRINPLFFLSNKVPLHWPKHNLHCPTTERPINKLNKFYNFN